MYFIFLMIPKIGNNIHTAEIEVQSTGNIYSKDAPPRNRQVQSTAIFKNVNDISVRCTFLAFVVVSEL